MVEVAIDSIRVSLMSQHRIIVLKDATSERFLPIWIGPYEAEAITVSLQGIEVARPLTHDLLRNVINALGAEILRVAITELKDDVFYAHIVILMNDQEIEIDSRPSDAIALAVRVHVPIFVNEAVMQDAASVPEKDINSEEMEEKNKEVPAKDADNRLDIFKDFVDTLDIDDLDEPKEESKN